MRNRIDSRVAALTAAIQRRKLEQTMPVDSLSKSLIGLGQELSSLDELGRLSMLAELNDYDPLDGSGCLDLTMADLTRMIGDYSPRILQI